MVFPSKAGNRYLERRRRAQRHTNLLGTSPGTRIGYGRTAGPGANSNHHIDNLSGQVFDGPISPTCDIKFDGTYDLNELDMLLYRSFNHLSILDFDHNGIFDLVDRDEWLRQAASLPGDANLDGVNNEKDLNAIGLHWRAIGVKSYGKGDSNGDGTVDAVDLNELGVWWNKTADEYATAVAQPASVPEPSSVDLVCLGLFGIVRSLVRDGTRDARNEHV